MDLKDEIAYLEYGKKFAELSALPTLQTKISSPALADPNNEYSLSGMDDEVRNNYKETHPIGTIISITHSGKTDGGKPRFARYLRKRDDIILKDEIENTSVEKKNKLIFILKKISDYEKANGEAFKVIHISGLGLDNDSDIVVLSHISSQILIPTFTCLLYTSPSPRDGLLSRMPSSA